MLNFREESYQNQLAKADVLQNKRDQSGKVKTKIHFL